MKSSAPYGHPSTEVERKWFACYGGMVFLGHLVEEDRDEVEIVEALPCRRCADA